MKTVFALFVLVWGVCAGVINPAAHVLRQARTIADFAQKSLNERRFVVQTGVIENPFLTICAGNASQLFEFDVSISLSGVQSCFNPICALIGPTGSCPSMIQVFDKDSHAPDGSNDQCPTIHGGVVSESCSNGCFSRLLPAFGSIGGCLTDFFRGLQSQICGAVPAESQAECNAGFASLDFSGEFSTEPMSRAINVACISNPANSQFCYNYIRDDSLMSKPHDILDVKNCDYLRALGCCSTSMVAVLNQFNGTVDDCGGHDFTALFTASKLSQALTNCDLSFIPPCATTGETVAFVSVKWTLNGISFDFYKTLNNVDRWKFWTAVHTDIGYILGINGTDANFLTLGNITAGSGPDTVVVTFVIRGTSSAQTNVAQGIVSAFLSSGFVPTFPAIADFADNGFSGLVTASGVSLDKTTSSSRLESQTGLTSGATPGAATAAVAIGTLLFACFTLLF